MLPRRTDETSSRVCATVTTLCQNHPSDGDRAGSSDCHRTCIAADSVTAGAISSLPSLSKHITADEYGAVGCRNGYSSTIAAEACKCARTTAASLCKEVVGVDISSC